MNIYYTIYIVAQFWFQMNIAKDECKIGDVLHPLDCENEKFVEWISYEIPYGRVSGITEKRKKGMSGCKV